MQRMFRNGVMLAVVAGAAASASASLKSFVAVEPQMLGPGIATRGGGYSTGFEAAEGYALGPIGGQLGWLTANGVQAVQDGVNDGNGSPNAHRLSKGTQASGTFGVSQAPAVAGSTAMSVDTRIDDNGGANYFVRGLIVTGPTTSALAFRVEFDYGGNIFLQNPVTGTFADTLVPWAPGNVWRSLVISVGPTSVDFTYGGNPLGSTPLPTAGAFFDLVQFGHDNYQGFLGSVSFSGEPSAGYFDNLNVIPAPGSFALLGLGGLLAGRRRR